MSIDAVYIHAGPGSGKTHAMAYLLLAQCKYHPELLQRRPLDSLNLDSLFRSDMKKPDPLEWQVGLSIGDELEDSGSIYTFLGLDENGDLLFKDSNAGDELPSLFTRPVGCIWIASLKQL